MDVFFYVHALLGTFVLVFYGIASQNDPFSIMKYFDLLPYYSLKLFCTGANKLWQIFKCYVDVGLWVCTSIQHARSGLYVNFEGSD